MVRQRPKSQWNWALASLMLVGAACSGETPEGEAGTDLAELDISSLSAEEKSEYEAVQQSLHDAPQWQRPSFAVKPILECVDKLDSKNYVAHFAYDNTTSKQVKLDISFNNRFFPSPLDRGQPTKFKAGKQAKAFKVKFQGPLLAWVLDGRIALAFQSSKRCTPAPQTCPATCDDGNKCTSDICDASTKFKCVHKTLSKGTSCEDGNMCNGAETCNANGECKAGKPKACADDNNPCTAQKCDPKTGCGHVNVADGTKCKATGSCGGAGVCKAGVCASTAPSCDDGNPCTDNRCLPTGKSSNPPLAKGTACKDTDTCNGEEVCDGAGACKSPGPLACQDDGNVCTVENCSVSGGCSSVPGNEDGACTVDSLPGACKGGVCVKKDDTACEPDNDPCTDTVRVGGVCTNVPAADGTTCSDGNACTRVDACQAGKCVGATPVVCGGASGCQEAGVCDPATGMCTGGVNKPDGASCDDANLCTTTDSCKAGQCVGTAKSCGPASDSCHTEGTCDPSTGVCSNPVVADGTACNDGKTCTTADSCTAGVCGGTVKTCAPSDACHLAGVCEESTGLCTNPVAPNGTTCSDGNACTQSDSCQAGTCTGGSPVTCEGSGSCREAGTCDPTSGLCLGGTPKADGTTCNDNNLCTDGDKCAAGQCVGAAKTCAPSGQCQAAGVCDAATGVCTSVPAADGTACNDGKACTTGDSCTAGACGGTQKTCTASDACHVAGVCEESTGVCTNPAAPNGTTCSDGNACTQADSCQAGACTAGAPVSCQGAASCTNAGTCDTTSGLCLGGSNKPDGTTCSDSNACTDGDVCTAGACGGTAKTCTASDQCHVAGTCDPTTGTCSNPAAADGTACGDGLKCTAADKCTAGVCGGTAVVCTTGTCSEANTTPDGCPSGPPPATCAAAQWASTVPVNLASDPAAPVIATVNGVAADADGNVYAVGSLFNTVAFPGLAGEFTSLGGSDLYVGAINASGAFTAVKSYGDDKDQNANNAAVNKLGTVGVIGGFSGVVDFGGPAIGPAPAPNTPYLAGVKADGSAGVFAVQIPLGTGGLLAGIAASPTDNGFVVCGTKVVSATNRDLYIAKYAATGALAWDVTASFAATGNQACTSVAFTDDGDVILGGNDAAKVLIAKLNGATGAKIWTAGFAQASGTPIMGGVVVDAAGDVYATGSFSRALTFGGSVGTLTPSGEDVFVVKVTGAAGTLVWAKGLGDEPGSEALAAQQGKGISVDSAGNVYATGIFKGDLVVDASTKLTAAGTLGTNDLYVVTLKGADGATVCAKAYGDDQNQTGNRIVTNRTGTGAAKDVSLVVGTFAGKIDFGGGKVIDAGLDQRAFVSSLK